MGTGSTDAVLVADIGGTHVRFGLAGESGVDRVDTYRCADHASPAEAARAYLARAGATPRQAALAVAGPIRDGRVRMTNHVWTLSIESLRRELALDRLEVLNDFAALALALPVLSSGDLREIKEGSAAERATMAVIGPGTGLGVAALVPADEGWTVLTTEGGHRDLAAHNDREWQIVRHLRERFEHVSVERVLSGPGLVNLYEAVSRLANKEPQSLTPAAIVAGARQGDSPACAEAAALFSGWLGAVTGDLAVTLGALGGIYLGGGVLLKMEEAFDVDLFRERFLAKGRFRDYLRPIPVSIIVHPHAALLGAARALDDGPAG